MCGAPHLLTLHCRGSLPHVCMNELYSGDNYNSLGLVWAPIKQMHWSAVLVAPCYAHVVTLITGLSVCDSSLPTGVGAVA